MDFQIFFFSQVNSLFTNQSVLRLSFGFAQVTLINNCDDQQHLKGLFI